MALRALYWGCGVQMRDGNAAIPTIPEPIETDVPFLGRSRREFGRIVERADLSDPQTSSTIEARNLAWQVYNTTGDDSELRRLGVLPLLDAAGECLPE